MLVYLRNRTIPALVDLNRPKQSPRTNQIAPPQVWVYLKSMLTLTRPCQVHVDYHRSMTSQHRPQARQARPKQLKIFNHMTLSHLPQITLRMLHYLTLAARSGANFFRRTILWMQAHHFHKPMAWTRTLDLIFLSGLVKISTGICCTIAIETSVAKALRLRGGLKIPSSCSI